ncbi:MAG TPA: protein-methionine-sulfoxide reductase heme-binding subunit MsrQ [Gemmatimonadales bacterium]|nr:protein-methionine-sulfoxide reductase heme-binding subunit MsrQ [Gemmatimonadales bacterium]
MTRLQLTLRILKPLGFLAALGPAAWLAWHALGDGDLGADPVKTIQVTTGLATLILLFVTLGITPLRRLLHWSELVRLRRMAGLFAFFYATLHALTYFVFDQSLDPGLIWADTVKHPRIAVGFVAFLMLIPLALTSTDRSIRRLGKRWGRLHRLIYPATALSVLHYLMVQKLDLREGFVFAAVFGGLMVLRLPQWLRRFWQAREAA